MRPLAAGCGTFTSTDVHALRKGRSSPTIFRSGIGQNCVNRRTLNPDSHAILEVGPLKGIDLRFPAGLIGMERFRGDHDGLEWGFGFGGTFWAAIGTELGGATADAAILRTVYWHKIVVVWSFDLVVGDADFLNGWRRWRYSDYNCGLCIKR